MFRTELSCSILYETSKILYIGTFKELFLNNDYPGLPMHVCKNYLRI
jgi:hypothetical protein